MIDYNKLKLAHELAEKYGKSKNATCSISLTTRFIKNKTIEYQYEFHGTEEYEEIDPCSLEDLITKLKELTQPKPKYKVDDTVWFHSGNNIVRMVVKEITNRDPFLYWNSSGFSIYECELHSSRKSLIQSQIDYWKNLLPKCIHESDTYSYIIQHSPRIYAKKCTKCHHFYDSDSINYLDKIAAEIPIDDSWLEICDGCSEPISCCDCPSQCQHESNGDVYTKLMQVCRCKKCGEYYR